MPFLPTFSRGLFDLNGRAPIDNRYFPLKPGTVFTFEGTTSDGETTEGNDFFVTSLRFKVLGLDTLVVRDTAYEDGILVEETTDFFAQDRRGNVWYLGEKVINYEYDDDGNFVGTNNGGAWQAGVNGAKPGWIMPANPTVGFTYYNEFAPGVALDQAEILSRNALIETDLGRFRTLKTLDTSVLSPGVEEFKYYAPGLGIVRVDEGVDENGVPDLLVELRDVVRAGTSRPPSGAEKIDTDDFTEGGEIEVTLIDAGSEQGNALGYYSFDPDTGVIGEGRILFADAGDVDPGEEFEIDVPDGEGIGFFLVPDGANLPIDLGDYEEGGLFFTNMLTGNPARLSDGMAPIVTDADGNPLPIPVFHSLGAARGSNLLNPGLGLQAVEWENGPHAPEDEDETVIGFEDLRRTQEDYDGDYDDLIIEVSGLEGEEEAHRGFSAAPFQAGAPAASISEAFMAAALWMRPAAAEALAAHVDLL